MKILLRYSGYLITGLSLLFVVFYLLNVELREMPSVIDMSALYLSGAVLLVGFLAQALAWWVSLNAVRVPATFLQALRSLGLTVFAKYIPGKIWLITGRATYVAKSYPDKAGSVLLMSTGLQFQSLLVAAILSLPMLSRVFPVWGDLEDYVIHFSLICILVFLLLYRISHKKTSAIKPFGETLTIRFYSALPVLCLCWLAWGAGFYCLLEGFGMQVDMLDAVSIFSISALAGILAYFVPGGLGVREGVMCFFLVQNGINLETGAAIVIVARLWFMSGELVLFVFALLNWRTSFNVRL